MADQDQLLEKVDIIRNRFGCSYREAYDMLERNQGNVVQACMALEAPSKGLNQGTHQRQDAGRTTGFLDQVEESVSGVVGDDVVSAVQKFVHTAQNSKIAVRKNGRTLFTIPTAVGAIGALFFPYVTVAATAMAVTARYEVVLDKRKPTTDDTNKADIDDLGHSRQQARVVNVHHEESVPIMPSLSSGKEASFVSAALRASK